MEVETVKIRVGAHSFETTKDTLTELEYFRAFFSEAMGSKPDGEGVYFVDADGDQFEHILTYIRHRKFPLFWHKESGFDYGRYSRLAAQADFFGVDRLKSWISVENYKGAIECRKSIGTIPMEEAFDGDTMGISPEIKVISTHWTTKKQYVCPRNIAPHMGRPKYCGRACSNALGNNKPEFRDKPIMTAVVEEEQIAFKLDQLTDGGD